MATFGSITFSEEAWGGEWKQGVLTSSVFNANRAVVQSAMSYSASTPTDTLVKVEARAGNTATPDGTWTSWAECKNGLIPSDLDIYQYMQYRIYLFSLDLVSKPVFRDITFNFDTA
jgi:hypothetical protein